MGQVSSHLLKHVVPAALLSAVVVVLTLGVAVAQAAPLVRGRGMPRGTLPAGHGGTSIGLVIAGVVLVAIAVGGAVYAIVADRRLLTPAVTASEPTSLPSDRTESEQKRKAA